MLKKMIIPVVLLSLSLSACGTPKEPTENKTSTISVVDLTEITEKQQYFPVSVTTTEEFGERLVIKNYEIDSNVNPTDLVEGEFVRNGYTYKVRDVLRKKVDNDVELKLASEQITIKTSTNDMNSVLKQAPVIIDYSDEQGYKGQLTLNTSNVFSESLGSKSYSYTVKETKTYSDLARNDSYYIPKTVEKNGRTLTLSNIEWATTGTTLAGNSLLPSSYSATAYYEGTAYGSRSVGYQTTLTYIGEVSREVDSGYLVSVIYSGEKTTNLIWLYIAVPSIIIIVLLILFLRKNKDFQEKGKAVSYSTTENKVIYASDGKMPKEQKVRKSKAKGDELNE